MKITKEHLIKIEKDCNKIMRPFHLHTLMIKRLSYAWSVFWKSQPNINWLYDEGYTDDHIETAVRNIFKNAS